MNSSKILIDTNVLSYVFKNHSFGLAYKEIILDYQICLISFQTLAELKLWAATSNWGENRKLQIDKFLDSFVTIYPDQETCLYWGDLMNSSRRKGIHLSATDAWIAATAIQLSVPLLTHNYNDFAHLQNLELITRYKI
ncbi:MAG: PIN domain-containing protein [Candidatus Sumerlaeia bacterium]|nr:PIN domain-containing protein [Candidatus Sumerlaeia bacterium]